MSPITARRLLAAYAVLLAVVFLWPAGDAPSRAVDLLTAGVRTLGVDPRLAHPAIVEVLANVAITVPLAVLGRLGWPAPPWWQWALLGLAVGVGAESAQALLLPDRFASPVDVVANTLGVALGAGLAAPAARRRHARRPGCEIGDGW